MIAKQDHRMPASDRRAVHGRRHRRGRRHVDGRGGMRSTRSRRRNSAAARLPARRAAATSPSAMRAPRPARPAAVPRRAGHHRLRSGRQDSRRPRRRLLSHRARCAVPAARRQHPLRWRRPCQHVPLRERPRELQEPLRAQRALRGAGKGRQDPVPDVPQSVPGRPQRQGQEPRHAQHAHHPSQRPAAGAEGRQPAGGDGPEHAGDARPGLHLQRPAARARPSPRTRRPIRSTGNMLAFGYEAKGLNTTDVNVFEYTPARARRCGMPGSTCPTWACCTTSPSPKTTSCST